VSDQLRATAALPPGKAPGTHWIGGWMNPRVGLDDVEDWKFLIPPGFELRPLGLPASSQSLSRLSLPRLYYNIFFRVFLFFHLFNARGIVMGLVARDGVWIVNSIYWTLTGLTTENNSPHTDSRTLQFTKVRDKSSQFVFTKSCLGTTSNTADS
jgi:hypothetical protein